MRTKTERRRPSRARRAPVLGAIGAAAALIASVLVPTVANAAPPQAGTYAGQSTAYTGATVSFDVDANGVMSNFNSESYCSDGLYTWPVQWAGMPPTQIEAGQSFEVNWEFGDGEVQSYYELQGVVNADGSASGTGRAGFLPYGTCGGMNFSWTATNTGGGDPDPADVEVIPGTVTESELANPGVRIEGEGFPGDDWVELDVNGVHSHRTMSAWDGAVTVFYDSDSLGAGTHELTLTGGGVSGTTTLTVTEDPVVYDPSASVSPAELTESELADDGVSITGVDFVPESSVTLSVNGTEEATQTANASGEVSFAFTSDSLGAGSHQVTLVSGDLSASASFTVTEDPVVYDPSASVTPEELTESELAEAGITITGAGFPANVEVVLSVNDGAVDTATSTDEGGVEFTYTSDALGTGTHTVGLLADGEGASASATFTVTEDEAPEPDTIPADAPEEGDLDPALEGAITAPGQAEAGESITVTVEGADAGTEVGVWLFSDPAYLGTHTVDASGEVVVTIPTGTELGEHTLAVWAAPDTQVGWAAITVIANDEGDDDGGGDDGDAGGDGGGDDGDAGGDGGAEGDGSAEEDGDTGSGDGSGESGVSDADEGTGADSGASEGDLAVTGAPYLPLIAALGALLLALGATLVWHTGRGRMFS